MQAYNTDILNVIIVDDEKKACSNLKSILLEFVDASINVLGFAHNTIEAEALITELKPDAVFLDIEMPNENAFAFLERIGSVEFEVIFVTAYDEYAIKAFRYSAIDYILKPISIPELKAAVDKLKERIEYKKLSQQKNSFYTELTTQMAHKTKLTKITLKDGNIVEIVDLKDVYYLEADGSYTKVYFIKEGEMCDMILSGSLAEYEELLPDAMFYRIHRSYLLNCAHVKKLHNTDPVMVLLKNEAELPVSRRRYSPFLTFLMNNDHYTE